MKVLYFHQHFSTPKGSAGIRSYQMAQKLISLGHQVTMVCGSYNRGGSGLNNPFNKGMRRGVVDGIDIIEFDLAYSNNFGLTQRAGQFLRFAARSVKLIFTENYDGVFATTTPLTAGIPGIFARWFRRKPFIFEVRDLWPELPKAMGVIRNPLVLKSMSFLEWATYRSANKLVGLSPGIVEGIRRKGILSKNIALIPNGCDLTIFSSDAAPWRPANVNEDDFLALYAGTHGIANGLDALLDVAEQLKNRKQDKIKLLLIGQGKLKDSLIENAKKRNLDNLIFHDSVNKQKLAGLMKSSDLGLQLLANIPEFYYGTSPNKFFDYIAAGLPVLNNYPGWISDMILEKNCGYTVPPDNSIAFADALEHALCNKQILKQMGRNATALAREQFDRDDLSTSFCDWLEAAIQR
ncbi:glycosyltransferase family 4 protein [Allopusillimonas ginsengisoli]|uniref:glycosyltransferase family 4 protein n=1 Tax=Allopusillimonas ginsengisoli TaxID=453575 RepID=UPI00101E9E91|nr:glycosyltransferase family 4 protein [Allopusillimonas ginsengisoli]TEA79951.1 glycosyltransferase WbuB [Allopusillimonas ginsengisoli]